MMRTHQPCQAGPPPLPDQGQGICEAGDGRLHTKADN